jgi:hypothetical protein
MFSVTLWPFRPSKNTTDALHNHYRLMVKKRQCLLHPGIEHRISERSVRSLLIILSYPAQEQCDSRSNSQSALLLMQVTAFLQSRYCYNYDNCNILMILNIEIQQQRIYVKL